MNYKAVPSETTDAAPEDFERTLVGLPGWLWQLVILVLTILWSTNFAVIKDIHIVYYNVL